MTLDLLTMSMALEKVGTTNDFPEDKATRVEVNGIPISVFNIHGSYYAIHNNCIHKNLPLHKIGDEKIISADIKESMDVELTKGKINEDELCIHCPWHNMKWDLETGYNQELNKSIPTFDTKVKGEDVYIEL